MNKVENFLVANNNIKEFEKKLIEQNKIINRLKLDKAQMLQFSLMALVFASVSLYPYIFVNIGINNIYYLIFTCFSSVFCAINLKNYFKLSKDLKIAKKQYNYIKFCIDEEKNELENFKTNSKKITNKNSNIKKSISPSDLKNKLLILKDYLLHQQEYQIYYNNGIIDWYLSEKYNKEDITFLKELIVQDLDPLENKNKKNKTNIK